MDIRFEKANINHIDIIFSWLAEPHIQEFWDNSQEHKDDILNFVNGRKQPSNYCNGLYTYWVGSIDNELYCLIMTLQEKPEYDIPPLKKAHLSKLGRTYSMDYMIGNSRYFGKGLGANTLEKFIEFFKKEYDAKADTFFIDPDVTNPRARHVYEKAGFEYIDDFIMTGQGVFAGRETHFLVKHIPLMPVITLATLSEYPIIQNLARFYAYDISRSCAFISDDWDFPENGLYESFDSKIYFEDPTRKAFLIRVSEELAGFVLIDQEKTDKRTDWNMGEFFITAKFQGKGLGKQVAHQIWDMYPGWWELSVIPENRPALSFWETTINDYTQGNFIKEKKKIDYDKHQPERIIFNFDSRLRNEIGSLL